MAAKPIKVYPIKARYLSNVPSVVQVIASSKEAEELVASGAFTLNPRDPERNMDAPDYDSLETAADEPVSYPDEPPLPVPASPLVNEEN